MMIVCYHGITASNIFACWIFKIPFIFHTIVQFCFMYLFSVHLGLGQTMEQHSLAQVQFPCNVRIIKIATKIDSCLALSGKN